MLRRASMPPSLFPSRYTSVTWLVMAPPPIEAVPPCRSQWGLNLDTRSRAEDAEVASISMLVTLSREDCVTLEPADGVDEHPTTDDAKTTARMAGMSGCLMVKSLSSDGRESEKFLAGNTISANPGSRNAGEHATNIVYYVYAT